MWLLPLLIALGAPFGADGVEKIVVVDVPPDGPLATSVYSRDADWVLIPIVGRCMRIHVYPSGIRVEPVEPEPREEATMALPDTGYALLEVSNPSSALTDFSLMVDLSLLPQDWWDAVDTTDPTKGRAAKNAGPVELACDWIAFDADTQTGWLRVKWTGTLASTGEQLLRVYPPQEANASVAADDTYGQYAAYGSAALAYYPAGGGNDRTSNQLHLTSAGSVTIGGISGKVGAATDYDGVDDKAYSTAAAILELPVTHNFAVVGWFRPDTYKNNTETIGWKGADDLYIYANDSQGGGRRIFWRNVSTSQNAGGGDKTGKWVHIAYVGRSNTLREMIQDAGTPYQNTAAGDNAGPFSTFAVSPSSPIYDGAANELWLFQTAPSAAWIAQEYAQTSDPATFWGEPEWVPAAGGGFNPAWTEDLNTYIGTN